jgi:hypothetical protein
MTRFPFALTTLVALLAANLNTTQTAQAQPVPVVQGPEAVADWDTAGKAFITQG